MHHGEPGSIRVEEPEEDELDERRDKGPDNASSEVTLEEVGAKVIGEEVEVGGGGGAVDVLIDMTTAELVG